MKANKMKANIKRFKVEESISLTEEDIPRAKIPQ